MATTQVKHCLLRSLHPVATQVTPDRPHAVVIYIRRVQGDNLSMLKGCYHDHATHTAHMWCFLCTVVTARTPFHAEINVIEFSSESLRSPRAPRCSDSSSRHAEWTSGGTQTGCQCLRDFLYRVKTSTRETSELTGSFCGCCRSLWFFWRTAEELLFA